MGVIHGPVHDQIAAHTGLETTCESGTSVQSVPETAAGQALPMELPVCPKHKEEWLWARLKQTKLICYNIKLFWTKREHPRSRIWHLWSQKEKKGSEEEGDNKKLIIQYQNQEPIQKSATEREAECILAEPEVQRLKNGFVNTKHFLKFLCLDTKRQTMATYRNSGNKLENNWANSYDLLREKFCI